MADGSCDPPAENGEEDGLPAVRFAKMPFAKADSHDLCQIQAHGSWQIVVVTPGMRMGKKMTSLRSTLLEKKIDFKTWALKGS